MIPRLLTATVARKGLGLTVLAAAMVALVGCGEPVTYHLEGQTYASPEAFLAATEVELDRQANLIRSNPTSSGADVRIFLPTYGKLQRRRTEREPYWQTLGSFLGPRAEGAITMAKHDELGFAAVAQIILRRNIFSSGVIEKADEPSTLETLREDYGVWVQATDKGTRLYMRLSQDADWTVIVDEAEIGVLRRRYKASGPYYDELLSHFERFVDDHPTHELGSGK